MKLSLAAIGAAAALVGTALAATHVGAAPPVESSGSSGFYAPPRELVHSGHVRSLVRRGSRYELRFDPAWWLGGVTAKRAAREDTGSSDVPNDYYVVEEGRRSLTYLVPATARATVLVNTGARGIRSVRVGVAELAEIVRGRNPKGRQLYGARLRFWIRVATDTVRSLDQQYQP
jgi:hypothetical protein